jgi:hypothetical protein
MIKRRDLTLVSVEAARALLDHGPVGGPSSDAVVEAVVEVALLDSAGVIVWVDQAWHDFCLANGGDPDRAGVGRSFLAICDDAAGTDPCSALVATAVRTALSGGLPAPTRVLVSCPRPERPREFDVLVSSRRDDRGGVLGATVTLSECVDPRVTTPPRAPVLPHG